MRYSKRGLFLVIIAFSGHACFAQFYERKDLSVELAGRNSNMEYFHTAMNNSSVNVTSCHYSDNTVCFRGTVVYPGVYTTTNRIDFDPPRKTDIDFVPNFALFRNNKFMWHEDIVLGEGKKVASASSGDDTYTFFKADFCITCIIPESESPELWIKSDFVLGFYSFPAGLTAYNMIAYTKVQTKPQQGNCSCGDGQSPGGALFGGTWGFFGSGMTPIAAILVSLLLGIFLFLPQFAATAAGVLQNAPDKMPDTREEDDENGSSRLVVTKPDYGYLGLSEKRNQYTIECRIETSGGSAAQQQKWKFSYRLKSMSATKIDCRLTQTGMSASIAVRAAVSEDQRNPIEKHEMTVIAESSGTRFVKTIGISTGIQRFRFLGTLPVTIDCSKKDSSTELLFSCSDIRNDDLVVYREVLEDLRLSLPVESENDEHRKAFETAECSVVFRGIDEQRSAAVYEIQPKRPVPGKNIRYRGTVRVVAITHQETHEQQLELALVPEVLGKTIRTREEEYALTSRFITEHTPEKYHSKFRELLDKRSDTLGPEGIYEIRKRIWHIAQDLWLAEGLSGYKNYEKWADGITKTLEWADWAGDYAVKIVLAYFLKWNMTVEGDALAICKKVLVEVLQALLYGRKQGELMDSVIRILGINSGNMLVENFANLADLGEKKLGMLAPFIKYMIFMSWEFYNNLNGKPPQSYTDAITNAGKKGFEKLIMDNFSGWLGGVIK
ncbi:MAG: hypothetical protein JW904_10600 [Spirochaetales bacterium]|nr:hypothetical protein [Spirochaetales bacterium]